MTFLKEIVECQINMIFLRKNQKLQKSMTFFQKAETTKLVSAKNIKRVKRLMAELTYWLN